MQVSYDDFINQWNNQQIHEFGGQCVAGIAKFLQENNLPIHYGDADEYTNNPLMAQNFDWIQNDPNDPNQLPQRGAIVVSDRDQAGSGDDGHICFFDRDLGNHRWMSFGQNAGGPTMHFQERTWAFVKGWYHYREPVAPPAPAPDPFTLTDIAPKQVTINRQTSRWNMGYSDLDQMKANPVESLGLGAGPYTVTVLCHMNSTNYDYYLENRNNLGGFNIYDCAEYFPPAVVVPEELPPPPKVWPMPPAMASDTTPYKVVKTIMGFSSATDAGNHENAKGTVDEGDYYVFRRYPNRNDLVNVTKDLGKPGNVDTGRGGWINEADNLPDVIPELVIEAPAPPPLPTDWSYHPLPVEVPVPTPTPELTPKGNVVNPNWRSSYSTFKDATGHDEKRLYIAMIAFDMVDQESTNRIAPVKQWDGIWMSGTFIGPDDQLYGMPTASRQDKAGNLRYWYYGCPMDRSYIRTEQEVYSTTTTPKEREVIKIIQDVRVLTNKEKNRQHQLQMKDLLTITPKEIESFVAKFMDFIVGNHKKKIVTINKTKEQ